jgi:outer membrane protein assembly factor BamB
MPHRLCLAACLLMAAVPAFAQEKGIGDFPKLSAATDWPWWRGPSRNGFAVDAKIPTKLSDTDNVRWKTKVPGRGHSSPIVVGKQVLLTTADETKKTHAVLAFDRDTGKPLWDVQVNQGAFPEKNHPKNTEATPTVACDGERIFATFYHHDKVEAVALDLKGKPVWKETVCPFRPKMYEYGYATSPLIYKNTVIVAAEYDGASFIIALDRATGKRVWKLDREPSISFSSPVVGFVAGKDQLLISGQQKVTSYDPANGKRLWSTDGTTHATCGTMVWEGDIVFASGGYPKAETLAVKADGSGQVLWRNNQKCYEQSMLVHNGYLYGLTDNGVMFCWRANDGKEMWKQRLTGPVSASPVLAGGNIYWANELGTMYVFRPNPDKFDLVQENQIGTDSFPSPAVAGNEIFLRVGTGQGRGRQEWLYSFADKK